VLVGAGVGVAVGRAVVGPAVGVSVGAGVGVAVGRAVVGLAVGVSVGAGVGVAVGGAVIGTAVGVSVGAGVGVAIGGAVVGIAVGVSDGAGVGVAVGGAVVGIAVGVSVGAGVGVSVGGAVVGLAVGMSVGAGVGVAVGGAVVGKAVGGPVGPGVGVAVGGAVVGIAVGVSVGAGVGVAIGGAVVGKAVGGPVEAGVGVAVGGAVVGIAVGVSVGAGVGVAVGGAVVGAVVGLVVGLAVGADVGVAVGVLVGAVVDVAVGMTVGMAVAMAIGVMADTGADELGDGVGPATGEGVAGTVTPDAAFTFCKVGSFDALTVVAKSCRSCSLSKGAAAKDSGVMLFVPVCVYTKVWVYSTTTLPPCNWRCPSINLGVDETLVTWMVVSKFETLPLASMEDLLNDSVNFSHELCAVSGNVVTPNKVIVNPCKVTVVTDGVGDTLLVRFVVGAFVNLTVGALVVLAPPTVRALVVLARPLAGALVDLTVRAFVTLAADFLTSSPAFRRKIRKALLWPVWNPTKSFCCKLVPSLGPFMVLDSFIVVIAGTYLYRNLLLLSSWVVTDAFPIRRNERSCLSKWRDIVRTCTKTRTARKTFATLDSKKDAMMV
jgi:hypothetical protein